ncbi:hypothetical protein [Kibdelosporangium philippinense]|uniref:hypothetical protein n=1 Tax=Kibdelosporangium philippinense TaxID=211113 RepID=UPI00361C75CD
MDLEMLASGQRKDLVKFLALAFNAPNSALTKTECTHVRGGPRFVGTGEYL